LLDSLLQEKVMDLPALLVFIGGFAVCAGAVFLISFLGAKEQTYEEALKEQKERNKDTKKPSKVKNADKKKKWKKSKGDGAEKNDADVEEDVVLVESVKEEEPVVVEETPEPSPLPTPEPKKPKSKKKKIVIEEVDVEEVAPEPVAVKPETIIPPVAEVVEEAVVETAAAEPVVEVAPEPVVKVTPTKTKAKKQKAESQAASTNNPRDLLTVIKKTAFNDEEAQAMINVLLTKQSGDSALNTSEEWIEQGKPSESQRLKQELAEVTKSLEEERNNKSVFEKQLTVMRRDLNEKLAGVKKALGAEHQRIMSEMAQNHTLQINQMKTRMGEMHNSELAMRGRIDELQLEKLHTVSQYQAQVDTLSHQLQMSQNVPAPTFNDPTLLSELEQLRSLRDRYEGQLNEFLLENKGLKEQVAQLEEVQGQLQGAREEVSRVSSSSSSLSTALTAAQAEANQLGLAKAALEAELARVSSQLEESRKAAPEASAAAQAELVTVRTKLTEKEAENVKLAEENERLAEQLASSVERPAADGEEAEKENGHAELEDAAPKGVEGLKVLLEQSEEWKDKFERLSMEHEKILAKHKATQIETEEKLAAHTAEIQAAATKNNELASSLAAAQEATTAVMARLFPDIQGCTEEKAVAYLANLSNSSSGEDVDRLEGQVEHYKTVLAQTESMLTSLQSSVESAESDWRHKLEATNKELTEVRGQAASLTVKNETLERELAECDSTEMQTQLAALQAQVLGYEAEKADLESRNAELSAKAEEMAQQVKELSTRQEELAKGNTGLQAALGVAQEAVERERGGIRALQEQLQTGKDTGLETGGPPSEEAVQ